MRHTSGQLGRREVLIGAGALLGADIDRPEERAVPGSRRFTNPLDVKVADPCMIRANGRYYLYGTASLPADADEGMPVWSSTDLVRWRCHGLAFRKSAHTWGTHWFWGPDVRQVADGFIMVYGAFRMVEGKRVGRICVARSASPVGPFVDTRTPMFDWPDRGDAIDAFTFADRDGSLYLYFTDADQGRNTIWAARLKPDGITLASTPTEVLRPDQPWEIDPVNEGAFVWRHGDTYLMMHSVNDFRNPAYGMGLATAPTPMGPWRKRSEGPILRQAPGLRGPGCAGLIPSPDGKELWAYYHVHLHPEGYARQLSISRARHVVGRAGGVDLRIDAPTTALQPMPSGAPPMPSPRSDAFAGSDLDRDLWTVVDESAPHWRVASSTVRVTALDGDMWRARCDYRNLFLQPPTDRDFDAGIDVEATLTGNYEQVFLIAWQDADHFVRLGMLYGDGPRLSAAIELDGGYEELLVPNNLGPRVRLRLVRRRDLWRFIVSAGSCSIEVGHAREARLALPRIGFGAIAPGTKRPYEAVFRDFRFARA